MCLNNPSSSDGLFIFLGMLENEINNHTQAPGGPQRNLLVVHIRELMLEFVGSTLEFIDFFLLVPKSK